jgi:DNA-directed RNA polymerase specialized sigma24 family protein
MGVLRAVAELPEPDQSVVRLRYGIGVKPMGEEEVAQKLAMTLSELWNAESAGLEMVGFLLTTEAVMFQFLEEAA